MSANRITGRQCIARETAARPVISQSLARTIKVAAEFHADLFRCKNYTTSHEQQCKTSITKFPESNCAGDSGSANSIYASSKTGGIRSPLSDNRQLFVTTQPLLCQLGCLGGVTEHSFEEGSRCIWLVRISSLSICSPDMAGGTLTFPP